MKIEKFYIGNYRSIHQRTLRFDRINVFVGPNNSGKSNIVRAMKLFFSPRDNIKHSELHADVRTQTVMLSMTISITERRERGALHFYKLTTLLRNDKLKIERRQHLGEKAKYYDLGRPNKKRILNDQEVYNLSRFFRKYFLFMDILNSETLDFEHLEKSISHIYLKKTSEYMINKFKKEIEPAFKRIDHHIRPFFDAPLDKFSKYLSLPKKNLHFKIVPDHEQMFKNIRLEMEQGDLDASLSNKGQGFKNMSAFILSGMFDVTRKHLIVLEEPEIHLHPSLTRRLMESIKNTPKYKQFFITTHSSNIINSLDPQHIKRVVMEEGKTKIITPKLKDEMVYDFYKYIYGNHAECLLSKRVVIVEGDTETRSLPGLSEKIFFTKGSSEISASLNSNEIQIVQVHGSNFHGPIKFLEAFEIDWLILGDADKWPTEYMATIKALRMNKAHPRKYRDLESKGKSGPTKTEWTEIRKTLYEYFNIISLPRVYEDILVTDENVNKVSQLLLKYLPRRYKDVLKHNKTLTKLDLCKEVMKRDKPQWAIVLGKQLGSSAIPKEITKLLDLIVNRPKKGAM
jgi:predicted ATP-dependent endonuclease of OLD family